MAVTEVTVLTRRRLLCGAAAAGVVAAGGCVSRSPAPPVAHPAGARLRLLGQARLPHGFTFERTTVGGLSAIDHHPASGLWLALSDDRSQLQPARFYTLGVDLSPGGLRVAVRGVTTLRQAGGAPFPRRSTRGEVVDPEGLRILPQGGGILWSSEGDYRVDQSPSVRLARLDGTQVRQFEVPPALRYASQPGTGPRDNATFEGLALTPDGRTAWVAMEGPLHEDGPGPGVARPGAPCRFTAFDVASGHAVRQIAYQPDGVPLAPAFPGGYADNGVVEILMLDAWRMLVLERSYSLGAGNSIRLYEIDTRAASDTLHMPRLEPGRLQPVADKRLVADFAQLGLSRIDNFEGLCWGPRLPNGNRTLVAVSDDNFSARQATLFAAFEYLEHP